MNSGYEVNQQTYICHMTSFTFDIANKRVNNLPFRVKHEIIPTINYLVLDCKYQTFDNN